MINFTQKTVTNPMFAELPQGITLYGCRLPENEKETADLRAGRNASHGYKDTKISFEEEDIKRSMENMLGKPKRRA